MALHISSAFNSTISVTYTFIMSRTINYAKLNDAIRRGHIETGRGGSSRTNASNMIQGMENFTAKDGIKCKITVTSQRLHNRKQNITVRFRIKERMYAVDYWLSDAKKWWRAFEASEYNAHYLMSDKFDRPCIKTALDYLIITSCVYYE